MRCIQCGKELAATAKFCNNCGTPVVQQEEIISSESVNMKEPTNNDGQVGITTNVASEKKEDIILKVTELKKNWKDKYTVFVIVGIMVIAVGAGLIAKKMRTQNEYSYLDDYAYEETSDEYYEEEYEEVYNDYGDSEEYYEESDEYYEEEIEQEVAESQDYIFPDSSSRYLSKYELNGLSAEECRIARNEIYARHGRMFNDEGLQSYFNSFEWYEPSIYPEDFQESSLNDYEVANRDLIVEYEYEQGYR